MKINEDFIKQTLNGECVLIPVGETSLTTAAIFKLNKSAEQIFDLLTEGKNTDEIVCALSREYGDTDPGEVRTFTEEFCAQLRKKKILLDD